MIMGRKKTDASEREQRTAAGDSVLKEVRGDGGTWAQVEGSILEGVRLLICRNGRGSRGWRHRSR